MCCLRMIWGSKHVGAFKRVSVKILDYYNIRVHWLVGNKLTVALFWFRWNTHTDKLPPLPVPSFSSNIYKLPPLRVPSFSSNIYKLLPLRVPSCSSNIYKLPPLRVPSCSSNIYKLPPLRVPSCSSSTYKFSSLCLTSNSHKFEHLA